jgi:hypothetical protein
MQNTTAAAEVTVNSCTGSPAIIVIDLVCSSTASSSDFTQFVLHRIRVARIRARMVSNAIEATTIALAGGLIDGVGALAMLDEAGLLALIEASS